MITKRPVIDIVLATIPPFVLLMAAIAKMFSLSPWASVPQITGRGTTLGIIVLEIIVAMWLFSTFSQRVARGFAIVLFTGFLLVSSTKLADGQLDCGCFGMVQVHPVVTLLIDVGAIICLVRQGEIKRNRSTRAICAGVFGSVLLGAAVYTFFGVENTRFDDIASAPKDSIIVMDPTNWVKRPLPILPFVSNSYSLEKDQWHLVLYDDSCGDCREHIERCLKSELAERFMFVAVTPPHGLKQPQVSDAVRWEQLDSRWRWYVEVPIEVVVEDGIVTRVRSRDQLE